jgi:hypothetical protein
MPLARAAGQVMAAALQQQAPIRRKTDGGVGTVDLLFHHEVTASNDGEVRGRQIFVAWLEAGVEDMARAWVFTDGVHQVMRAMATMWFRT